MVLVCWFEMFKSLCGIPQEKCIDMDSFSSFTELPCGTQYSDVYRAEAVLDVLDGTRSTWFDVPSGNPAYFVPSHNWLFHYY